MVVGRIKQLGDVSEIVRVFYVIVCVCVCVCEIERKEYLVKVHCPCV